MLKKLVSAGPIPADHLDIAADEATTSSGEVASSIRLEHVIID